MLLPRSKTLALWAGLVSMAAFLVLLYVYAQRAAFHSDELNVLHHVSKFASGDVGRPGRPGLLWFLLTPLMALDDPVAILRGARLVSWLAVATSCLAVLSLSWPRQKDRHTPLDRAAPGIPLLAVGLLASAGLFTTHGMELRTDTFTTPLTLLVMVVLWRRPPRGVRSLLIAGVLVAAAALISQKSLYNASGLALAWFVARPTAQRGVSTLRWRVRDAGLAVVVVGGLIALWYALLALKSGGGSAVVTSNLETARSTAFGTDIPWADKMEWFTEAVQRSPILYFGAALGLGVSFLRRSQDGRPLASACVAVVMLGVITIHRGFFPYYIASVEPFLVLPAAWGLASVPLGLIFVARKLGLRNAIPAWVGAALALWILCLGAFGPTLMPGVSPHEKVAKYEWGSVPGFKQAWAVTSNAQFRLARDVHELVGEPSNYIGGIGVVPGYSEVTGYLTGVTRRKRRAKDRYFIATAMKERGVKLFVRTYMTRETYLYPKERKQLYTSYLPVRPNIYLHGARVRWKKGGRRGKKRVEVFVEGDYSLYIRKGAEELQGVWVDGKAVVPGGSVHLSAGKHEVEVGPSKRHGELWLLLGKGVRPDPPGKHVDYSVFPKDRAKSRSRYQIYDKARYRKAGKKRKKDHTRSHDLLSPPGTERHDQKIGKHRKALQRREQRLRRKYRKYVTVKRDGAKKKTPSGDGQGAPTEDGSRP